MSVGVCSCVCCCAYPVPVMSYPVLSAAHAWRGLRPAADQPAGDPAYVLPEPRRRQEQQEVFSRTHKGTLHTNNRCAPEKTFRTLLFFSTHPFLNPFYYLFLRPSLFAMFPAIPSLCTTTVETAARSAGGSQGHVGVPGLRAARVYPAEGGGAGAQYQRASAVFCERFKHYHR
jgi:hypothetical protein